MLHFGIPTTVLIGVLYIRKNFPWMIYVMYEFGADTTGHFSRKDYHIQMTSQYLTNFHGPHTGYWIYIATICACVLL